MDGQTATIVILALQVVLMAGGAFVAYLVKKGKIDQKTVEESKRVANWLAGTLDELKGMNPDAASKYINRLLEKVGDDKPLLDAFLKAMNLNKPHH